MDELRFAVFGAGFWAGYQLAAWREIPGARCVAVYNRTRSKADELAARFGVQAVYDDPEELLTREQIDFVDIITDVGSHERLVKLAADHGRAAICQKPLAPTLAAAESMVSACRDAGVPLLVHENWRWQPQIRAFAETLARVDIGRRWRAHINYWSSFPCFTFQPFLKELEQFILTDIGTHILDTMRLLFGEAESVYALAHSVSAGIRGEDAVSALFRMRGGMTVYANMSYASRVPGERFPETFITVEGEDASASLGRDFEISVVTRDHTVTTRHPPPYYPWADPRFGVAHASIVEANRHLLAGLRERKPVETTGTDNLETLRLVFACYESIRRGEVVRL